MIGTLINAAAIVAGGLIGLFIKKLMPDRLSLPIMKAEGLAVIVIGLVGVINSMITVKEGNLKSSGEMVLLVSLVLGCLIGELLDIDAHLNHAAGVIEKKIGREGFASGFVNATLIYCVGAMTIMGPIAEALTGDRQLLFIKSILDGVTSIMLGATLGYGVIFAAVPVLILQSGFFLSASLFSNTPQSSMNIIFMDGYTIVAAVGINFLSEKKIKTANLLPALLIAAVYNVVKLL